ncbi:MAG: XdhC family protein [Oligoflexales bacterium]
MNYQEIWMFIHTQLKQGQGVAVMMVAENTSGSPGRKGFKMAISQNGLSCGTIGGGIMEFKLVKKAQDLLKDGCKEVRYIPQIHLKNNSPHQSGMICAGSQVILLYTFFPDEVSVFRDLVHSFQSQDQNFFFLFADSSGLKILRGRVEEGLRIGGDKKWIFQENIDPSMYVYIVGGGHVGYALSKVLSTLDAYITIFDHRGDLEMVMHNQYCHRMIVGPYEDIGQYVLEGDNSYGLVVSTSFKTDEAGLRQLLTKKLRYLGVMGSGAKIKQILANLSGSGFTQSQLQKIKAPIGLNIKSRTAAEIGISIAAELIQEKNAKISIPTSIPLNEEPLSLSSALNFQQLTDRTNNLFEL